MVAEGYKEIKEQLRASVEHLQLHCATSLESAAGSDDQSQIMCSQFGVGLRSVGICISCRGKDSAALNARFCFFVREKQEWSWVIMNLRRPCLRRDSFFNSSSPYLSAAQ